MACSRDLSEILYADPMRHYMARRSDAPETVKLSAVWYHRFDVPYRRSTNHIDRAKGISTAWFFTDAQNWDSHNIEISQVMYSRSCNHGNISGNQIV